MSDKVKGDYAMMLGKAAKESADLEMKITPKPGLVDALNSGCHTDMDMDIFISSSLALSGYWPRQALAGLDMLERREAMRSLRSIGREMESAMFAATNGVNTHKGLIYLLSLLLYGAGFSAACGERPAPRAIVNFAARPANGSVEEGLAPLKNRPPKTLTHGERLFVEHGVTGIRGEAEGGFHSIIDAGLPEFSRVMSIGGGLNSAGISALLAIMEVCEDSNVMHRGGYDFWTNEYKGMVREARENFDPLSGDTSAIRELEKKFLKLRISPGGAADLLCCTIFLHKITNSPCQQYDFDVFFDETHR